jgi:hypothetical protein
LHLHSNKVQPQVQVLLPVAQQAVLQALQLVPPLVQVVPLQQLVQLWLV